MDSRALKITITPQLIAEWEKELEETRTRIQADTRRLNVLEQRLNSLILFVDDAVPSDDPVRTTTGENIPQIKSMSLPGAVLFLLKSETDPISKTELRERLEKAGYPKERFGKAKNYFYTSLVRLEKTGKIVRRGEKVILATKIISVTKPT